MVYLRILFFLSKFTPVLIRKIELIERELQLLFDEGKIMIPLLQK